MQFRLSVGSGSWLCHQLRFRLRFRFRLQFRFRIQYVRFRIFCFSKSTVVLFGQNWLNNVDLGIIKYFFFFFRFTAHLGLGFYTLFVQYYSVICRPSDHTVGRPLAENRTRDGRSRG